MKSSVSDRLEELRFNRRDSPVFVTSGFWLSGGRGMSGRLTSPSDPIVMISNVITIVTIIVAGRYD